MSIPRAHPGGQVLNFRIDSTTTAGYTYYGESIPGTATASAGWSITRKDSSGNFLTAGSGDLDQVWDNRASLTYA